MNHALCAFKGRRRTVIAPGSWTELFFLDEATALAAGHRPCFECRGQDGEAFRAAWATGNSGLAPKAAEMDAMLHGERLSGREKRVHPIDRPIPGLPNGAMIGVKENSFVVVAEGVRRWTPSGYVATTIALGRATLLTHRAWARDAPHAALDPAGAGGRVSTSPPSERLRDRTCLRRI